MAFLEPVIDQLIDQLIADEHMIPEERFDVLDSLIQQIRKDQKNSKAVRLNFICTHNSRRSQIAQIWAHTAAAAFQIPHVASYSGGTEATSFHPSAIRAMRTVGFKISPVEKHPESPNPHHNVIIGTGLPSLICFSKRFEDAIPPDTPFTAVMTCSEADQNCPLVPGARARIPLTFEDPKKFDGTDQEQEAYLKTVIEIGRELIRVFRNV